MQPKVSAHRLHAQVASGETDSSWILLAYSRLPGLSLKNRTDLSQRFTSVT